MRFLMIVIFCFASNGFLQASESRKDSLQEKVLAVTDRTMFISGERINFSACVVHPGGQPSELSKILYAELLTPERRAVAVGKFTLRNAAASGWLTIPDETPSGVFLLRFYTAWMRNEGPESYCRIAVRIIHPERTEVVAGKAGNAGNEDNADNAGSGGVRITFFEGDSVFGTRERVRCGVEFVDEALINSIPGVSVVPELTAQRLAAGVAEGKPAAEHEYFYPETRGVSLSGRLHDKSISAPLRNSRIYLSVIGDRDIRVVTTDSAGRFYFALPDQTGRHDIFLSSEELRGITPELLINQDFCTRPFELALPPFSLTDQEKEAALKLLVSYRISSAFFTSADSVVYAGRTDSAAFYGAPSQILSIEKYIDLPTLEEYFTELPTIVKIRRNQGMKKFRFVTPEMEQVTEEPLILVDWVAVNDMKKILAMSPAMIDRIELVSSVYIKGNITYGGIISFISKKNDFAGIDLPASGTFINFRFPELAAVQPGEVPALPANLPDSRSTVYWNSVITTEKLRQEGIYFTTPDTPGRYQVNVTTISGDGKIFTASKSFTVMASPSPAR